MEEVLEEVDLAEVGKSDISFSKGALELSRYDSVKKLLNYINNKDVELDNVRILIKKANRELRIYGKQLYIRKSSVRDREAENRICITKR